MRNQSIELYLGKEDLVLVECVQAAGYFSECPSAFLRARTIIYVPTDWPMRKHFVIYMASCRKQQNLASLDELQMLIYFIRMGHRSS